MRRQVIACLPCVLFVAFVPFAWSAAAQFEKAPGYQGIWYSNQPTKDEYVYKYSGGLGTYCADHIPMAVYAPEVKKTFFVYGGANPESGSLLEMVSYYDHETGLVPRPTVLIDKKTDDAHDNPVISLDGDGHVWVFASSHGTLRPSYIFKSKAPYNVDDFQLVAQTNFSYPQPWYFSDHGFFFLHTRYEKGRSLYLMTSPDGVAWSQGTLLARIDEGHYQVSWPCGEKIGTAFNYHPDGKGLNFRTNLYYMEANVSENATWRNANSEVLQIPLRMVTNPAMVHDYASEGLKVYVQDVNYDSDGRPIILYLTSKGWEPGPQNGPHTWRVAHWTGSAWAIHDVTTSDNNYDTGCLHMEPDGMWRIIGPTEAGPQAYNPGGEIVMWTSRDQGKTWNKERQLTHDSTYNHTFVRRPLNAHPDFYVFWADGHARQRSESRLYVTNKAGDRIMRLPFHMNEDHARPEDVYTER